MVTTTSFAVEIIDAQKSFGATRAVASATLRVRPGEIVALVGENGSGKSTLVKMLAGVHRPDAGTIVVDGAVLSRGIPSASLGAGVATVFQEVLVAEGRSVRDNVWLGNQPALAPLAGRAGRDQRAASLLERLLGRPVDLSRPIDHLSLSDRQLCCIARALLRDPRVLVLDEATSALDVGARDRLFDVVRESARSGTAVVFISHRMDEVSGLAGSITVMRSGSTVAEGLPPTTPAHDLVELMSGSSKPVGAPSARRVGRSLAIVHDGVEVKRGEVLGVAGLDGQGQDAFLRSLVRSAGDRAAYVPRDRRSAAIFPARSILENFALPSLGKDSRFGLISLRRTRERFARQVHRLAIRLGHAADPITTLSGGNQQKVVIARWLACEPEILVLDDPTRGIDLGAKRDLYRLLGELVESGIAVVMYSTDTEELIELMDRIVVFRGGRVAAELPGADSAAELVGAYFHAGVAA